MSFLKLRKIRRNTPASEYFFNKVSDLELRRYFPVNFANFIRRPFLIKQLQWLLLWICLFFWCVIFVKINRVFTGNSPQVLGNIPSLQTLKWSENHTRSAIFPLCLGCYKINWSRINVRGSYFGSVLSFNYYMVTKIYTQVVYTN